MRRTGEPLTKDERREPWRRNTLRQSKAGGGRVGQGVHDRSRQRTPWNCKPQRPRRHRATPRRQTRHTRRVETQQQHAQTTAPSMPQFNAHARKAQQTQVLTRTQPAWPSTPGTIRGSTKSQATQNARAAYRNIFAAAAAAAVQRYTRNPQRGGTQQVNSKTSETHRTPQRMSTLELALAEMDRPLRACRSGGLEVRAWYADWLWWR